MLWQNSIHLASAEKIIWFLLMWISFLLPGSSHSPFSVSGQRWWWKKSGWLLEALTSPQWGGWATLHPSSITWGDNVHDRANGRTYFLPILISSPRHCDTPSSRHFSGSPGTKGITLALSRLKKSSLFPSYPLFFPYIEIFGLRHLGIWEGRQCLDKIMDSLLPLKRFTNLKDSLSGFFF